MATWPYARRTTYVNGSLPAIDADDLDELQDKIVDLYGLGFFFGDGTSGPYAQSSGTIVGSANQDLTTLDLTATANLIPNAHIIRAQDYIRLRGTSQIYMGGATPASNSATGGIGGGLANQTLGNGGAGGNGAASAGGAGGAGTARTQTSLGGSGGNGGDGDNNGGAPGAHGAGGVASLNAQLDARNLMGLFLGMLFGYNGSSYGGFPIQGGAGGGGGGGNATMTFTGLGGGGGGGVIVLAAPIIDIGAGCSILAPGGAGGSQAGGAIDDYGGGGGGGGGGTIILLCTQLIESGTLSVPGGAAGTSLTNINGSPGSVGTIIRRIIAP